MGVKTGISGRETMIGGGGGTGPFGDGGSTIMDVAAGALERLKARSGESADEWAEMLASTFFADLDRRIPDQEKQMVEGHRDIGSPISYIQI